MKKKFVLISLVALLILSACAAKSESNSVMEEPMMAPAAGVSDGKDNREAVPEEYVTSQDGEVTVDRLVIKNAYMNVAVPDATKAMQDLSALAESMGGFVVSSNVWNNTAYDGTKYIQSSITVRVPAEKLEEVLAKIRAMAADPKNDVISESVSGEDVTSDYVDSQSRLRNLEAAEQQLVELLDSATDLQYTMEIFRELTSIRSEIEVLKGHIKYLEESAAMSAVSVEFVAESSLQPIQIGPWKPAGIVKEAVQALVKAAQKFATGLIWFVITWLPFLIPFGLIIYFIVKGIRKHRAARKARKNAEMPAEQPKG